MFGSASMAEPPSSFGKGARMTGAVKQYGPRKILVSALALLVSTASVAPAAAAEPLRVVGYRLVMEMAPMLLAAEKLPAGSVIVENGGIPSLWPAEPEFDGTPKAKGAPVPDLAGNAETQALRQSVKHPDLRIILTVTEGMYRMIAKKSSGIQEMKDLKGKRILTGPNTSSEVYLEGMLKRAGMTMADVTVVPIAGEKGGDALLDGRADAIAYWEYEPERVRQRLGDDAVEFNEFGVYREIYNLNATAATLADPVKRRQVVDYVRVLIGACHESTYKPARAQELLAKNSGFDPKLIEASWEHHRFPCNLPLDLLPVLVEEEKWLAAKEKRQPRNRDQLAKLIDPSILAEARKPR
jgi:NitT/TauT family transport system substrate-binding protein